MDLINLNKDNFHRHMVTKAGWYEPDELILGDDFAVFDFTWVAQNELFRKEMGNLINYNYDIKGDNQYRTVIINKGDKMHG